uniref:Zinc ribbon domain-containing protein n=1 Tax=Nelumbo nucifera TaxID=4432 RepID=A0A822XLJ6_NELNU|nr:TPA_asm: hypothetical protein HUJ06_021139 [Nelumbo nucifera]
MFFFFVDAAPTAARRRVCHVLQQLLPLLPSILLPPSPSVLDFSPSLSDILRCHSCSHVVEPEFSFCPFCSSAL